MTWTGQTFSVGQILTAAQMNNLQADITAQANGDSGAPKQQQAGIASAAIGQSQLNTATNAVSVSNSSSFATLSGGQYSLYIQMRASDVSGGVNSVLSGVLPAANGDFYTRPAFPTSYTTKIGLAADTTKTVYVQNRYIQASPPYDLGDGNLHFFIYLKIDNGTGDLEAISIASDPVWAYNGPKFIQRKPDGYALNEKTGLLLPLKKIREIEMEEFGCREKMELARRQGDIKEFERIWDRLNTDKEIYTEITQSIKNQDMDILNHPFIDDDLTSKTVVLLDPMHKHMEYIKYIFENEIMENEGDGIQERLYNKKIKVSNTVLNRKAPIGLQVVDFRF